MFDVRVKEDGHMMFLGRLDATQADRARTSLQNATGRCTIDMGNLEYISSAGLAVLLEAQQRLRKSGHSIRLIHPTDRIRELLHIAGFDLIFDIE